MKKLGLYEHPHPMLQNKMVTTNLGLEIYALTTIPERADVGDWSGGERGTSETPPKPLRRRVGHRGAFSGLEGYYRDQSYLTLFKSTTMKGNKNFQRNFKAETLKSHASEDVAHFRGIK